MTRHGCRADQGTILGARGRALVASCLLVCGTAGRADAKPPQPRHLRVTIARARIQALTSGDDEVRILAARQLRGYADALPADALAALRRATADRLAVVRLEAVMGLGALPTSGVEARTVLAEVAKTDTSQAVRMEAAAALRQLRPDLQGALRAAGVKHPDRLFRAVPGAPTRRLRRVPHEAVPGLVRLLRHKDPALRVGAIGALHLLPSDRPPSLDGEGAKVQPAWLYGYLRGPTPLRPWLPLRMPTPALTAQGAEEVAAFLAARSRASYPFHLQSAPRLEGAELAAALRLFSRFQCLRCHLLSNAPRLKPGELSPDLALSGARLRRAWIRRFILEPQAVMPGTKMPTLFPLADEDDPKSRQTPVPELLGGSIEKQIDVLTDLNLFWGSAPASVTSGGAPAPR